MRLYLSSQNIGEHGDKLLKLVGDNKKVLYTNNAKDYWDEKERKAKSAEHGLQFESLGFEFTEVDLRNYFEKKIDRDFVSRFGLIWASGGNAFLLNKAIQKSGLDKIIIKLLSEDRIVYGGSSAGSMIMTPSLIGCDRWDDISFVEKIYKDQPLWGGLNLVDFYFVPHYQSDRAKEEAEDLLNFYKSKNFNFKAFKDGQVWLVDGDREELLV